jgi:hypothetical protein
LLSPPRCKWDFARSDRNRSPPDGLKQRKQTGANQHECRDGLNQRLSPQEYESW